MRIPAKPPSTQGVWKREDALEVIKRIGKPDVQSLVNEINSRYLAWDHIRFKPLPEGVSVDDLWFATKMSRAHLQQQLPLSFTSKGKKLYYVSPPKHQELIHRIDKQGGGTIGVSNPQVFGDDSPRYMVSSLMEEAIASSQLEGACTTRKVAKEMLRSKRKPRTIHERMIANNYQAMLLLQDLRKTKLTPNFLCHLQSVLMTDTMEHSSEVGRFRREDELITVDDLVTNEVLHFPPPAAELNWRIKEICDFANAESDPFIHPVVKAALLHFAIGYVHPFVDGNGRTARALFYWYMLKQDYWLFEYFPISRVMVRAPAKYARAYLYTETDEGDATYFIRYNLDVVLKAIGDFHEYVAREDREARAAAMLLEAFPGLNQRQRFLVHDALKKPDLSYTFGTYQGKYRVTNPTARADLLHLVQLGFLQQDKSDKTHIFYAAPDLRERLHLPPKSSEPKKEKTPKAIAATIKKASEASLAPSDLKRSKFKTTKQEPLPFDEEGGE